MYKKVVIIFGVCLVLVTGCGKQEEKQAVIESKNVTFQTERKDDQKEKTQEVETKIASDYTGTVLEDNKICYYKNGDIDNTYTGLAEYDDQWWYINNGVVDYDYTGVAYKDDGLWYVSKGVVDSMYTGEANFLGRTLNVKNGYIDSTFSVPKPNEAVINVPKSEVKVAFENSYDIYETHYTDQTNPNTDEYEFTSGDKGLYRIIAGHRVEDSSGNEFSGSFLNFKFSILDKYRNELAKHTGKLKNLGYDVGVRTVSLNAGDKYIFSDETTRFTRQDDKYIGRRDISVLFLKPYIDISGATLVNDRFDESVFNYIGNINSDKAYSFASYDYTPSESGNYIFWFDNIEISRGKELFSDNNLFFAGVVEEDKMLCSKEVYVNGSDTQMQTYLEKGRTYQLKLAVRDYNNSEVYHNGDVSFSIHIGQEKTAKNITGYTSISDRIDYLDQKNSYIVIPCRKQTVDYVLSGMKEDAKINVKIYDTSRNEVYSYSELGNGARFKMEDTIKDNEYEIVIDCNKVTDYTLSCIYQ